MGLRNALTTAHFNSHLVKAHELYAAVEPAMVTQILDWFRAQVDEAGGGNYQTLINDVLHEHLARQREPLESTIRRVIREELRRTG